MFDVRRIQQYGYKVSLKKVTGSGKYTYRSPNGLLEVTQ
jgi:hypothetical protein